MNINTKEILRYSGYKSSDVDFNTAEMIEQLKKEVLEVTEPKSIYREVSFQRTDSSIIIEGTELKSKKLVSHLRGSDRLIIFAATLGVECDILLRKYTASDSARAVLAQATLAAACESYCDEICLQLAQNEIKNGYYLRPRFSPGYADFDLTEQKKLFTLLDITKRIGVYLSDDCLMTPTKSVTALIGLTKEEQCNTSSCIACENTECEFRRS